MKTRPSFRSLLLLAISFAMIETGHAQANKNSILNQLSDEFAKAAEKIKPSVVSVRTASEVTVVNPYEFFYGPRGRRRGNQNPRGNSQEVPLGMGSGIILANGYVLTNNHVIQGADSIYVKLADGRLLKGRVVGADPNSDVAVIKIINAEKLVAAELGDSDATRVGEWVLAVGNPLGLEQTVTSGIISAKGRSNVHIANYEDFIQTDAAINPGNSGGPLVNMEGKVIGINTAIASQTGGYQGMGFAIPINMARTIMESLIRDGKVSRAYLGVQMQEVNPEIAEMLGLKSTHGVIVVHVEPGSPAANAGLQAKDLIIRFNGKQVDSGQRLLSLVKTSPIGQEINLTFIRDGQEKTAKIKLAAETPQVAAAESLGIEVSEITPQIASQLGYKSGIPGVVITRLLPNSRAAAIGLQEGDLIIGINKQKVTNTRTYSEILAKAAGSEKLLLHLVRGNQYFYAILPLK
ncbi:MAG: DegQ family serine endoprotease [Verrucomicrobiae bacterium]|nr:DegQ family serine endoprotease [Verrucomicrobiae bacterium]